jgi:hypothetical protein
MKNSEKAMAEQRAENPVPARPKPCENALWSNGRWMVPFEGIRDVFAKVVEDYEGDGMRMEGYEFQGGCTHTARRGIAQSIKDFKC